MAFRNPCGWGFLSGGAKHQPNQLEGNANFWWTIQDRWNRRRQAGSDDPVAQSLRLRFQAGPVGFTSARPAAGSENLAPHPAGGADDTLTPGRRSTPGPGWFLYPARFKIPPPAESGQPDQLTDFIVRSTFARSVSDWSLSRTPFISSLMPPLLRSRPGRGLEGSISKDQARRFAIS